MDDTTMALRMSKKLKDEFFEATKADEQTPSQVVRRLIKQWLVMKKNDEVMTPRESMTRAEWEALKDKAGR